MPLVETNDSMEKKEKLYPDRKYKKITHEDMYQIYKELRNAGIIWTDPKIENLGRLIKRNEINYHGIRDVPYESTGMRENKKKKVVLEAGEIVIIDTDYIFREEELEGREIFRRDQLIGFEERYFKELEEMGMNR